jgi:general transcription factor 3C polypeptide 3 (transcription factor C subunit 4)
MLATLGGGMQAMESYIDSKFQKAALREVRLTEKSAQGLPLRWSDKSFRYIYAPGNADAPGDDDPEVEGEGGSDADNDGETGVLAGGVGPGDKVARMAPQPPRATKISPVMLAQYGQICLCARSFQSAIWEFIFSGHCFYASNWDFFSIRVSFTGL